MTTTDDWLSFAADHPGAHFHGANRFSRHTAEPQETYYLTKVLDPSRPCHDTIGCAYVRTDIFTVGNYEQETKKFREGRIGMCRLVVTCPESDRQHVLRAQGPGYSDGQALAGILV